MNNKVSSLKQMIENINPSASTIDYIIKTKHSYIVIINKEYNSKILIPSDLYLSVEYDKTIKTAVITTSEPIKLNGTNKKATQFEIDLLEPENDVLGFPDIDSVYNEFNKEDLNNYIPIRYKIIFSPQLAKYLLKCGFRIVDIKKRVGGSDNEYVPVFLVEPGFYEKIQKYKTRRILQ